MLTDRGIWLIYPECLSSEQSERLECAAVNAVTCELATHVPAELTLAQWAVESGWGQHQPGNNCFGIKAYNGCYGTQLLETTEVVHGVTQHLPQEFATFPTLAECFEKHARLICEGPPYATVWVQYEHSSNLGQLIHGIAPIYSTSPTYGQLLLEVVSMQPVQQAILAARNSLHQPPQPVPTTSV